MKKLFLLLLFASLTARAATYQVALPGGGVLTVNGAAYTNPAITNSASVVWGVDGAGFLYATATGTNSSVVYVEGTAVAGPNFGLSTEVDPVVTASTNITFSLVNGSITTNKIDPAFYSLLLQTGAGDVVTTSNNTLTGNNVFTGITALNGGWTPFTNKTRVVFEGDSLSLMTTPESQVGWPSAFTNRMAGLNLIYGTNAATTGQQISTMLTDYATQIAPWAPSGGTNAILFFWGGVNDIYYSNSWSIAFQRITNYWQTAKASGFQLVGFEVTDSTNLTANARSQLPLLNDALRRHARTYCDWFVNTTELFHDALDTNWVTAGVHYTTAANRLLADYVRWNLLQNGDYHPNAFGAKAAPANYFRSLQFVSNSVPQTQQGGMLAWDADAQAAGRGALIAHDGTTNTVVVAVQITDTPANGQVPKWNTGGTITWEDDTGGTGSVYADGVAISNILSSASITNTVATGASTLSIRNSGVTAGTYSNIVAAIGADGRVTSAESATNLVLSTISASTITATTVTGDGTGLTFTTAAPGTSNTAAATTAFVQAAVLTGGGGTSIASNSFWQANGDLAVGSGASTAARLPVGNVGDRLVWNGTNLVYSDSRTYWEFNYEGGGSMSSGDFATTSGNGGAAPSASYAGEAGHPGVVGGTTGITATNGYTGFGSRNNAIIGGYGAHFFEGWIKTPSALPSTQPYYLLCGLHDQNSTTAVVDGPGFFRLSAFGDVWQFVSRNNSTETTNSLTSAAVVDTWYHLRADVASGGSNVVFRINGTPVATNSANIPTGTARAYGAQYFIMEDGGTTNLNQTFYFDTIRAGGVR